MKGCIGLKGKVASVLVFVGILSCTTSPQAAEVTDKIKSTIDRVVEVLKDESLKGPEKIKERRARIREVIKERFSFEMMAKRSLGKHWKARSDDEKREFVALFADLVESSYIEKIEAYTGEEVIYTNETMKGKASEVKTKIVTSKGAEIPVNYRLRKDRTGEWMVYDVIVEGVSLVRNYRTQFKKVISSSSYEELVKKLRAKSGGKD